MHEWELVYEEDADQFVIMYYKCTLCGDVKRETKRVSH